MEEEKQGKSREEGTKSSKSERWRTKPQSKRVQEEHKESNNFSSFPEQDIITILMAPLLLPLLLIGSCSFPEKTPSQVQSYYMAQWMDTGLISE